MHYFLKCIFGYNSTCFGQFSFHNQEFFTVNTALVYVTQVC